MYDCALGHESLHSHLNALCVNDRIKCEQMDGKNKEKKNETHRMYVKRAIAKKKTTKKRRKRDEIE